MLSHIATKYIVILTKYFYIRKAILGKLSHQFVDDLHNIIARTVRILFISCYCNNMFFRITFAREINLNVVITTYFTDYSSSPADYFRMIFRIDFKL